MLALFEDRFPSTGLTDLSAGVDLSGYQAPSIWNHLDWAQWSCAKVTEGLSYTERLAVDHSMAAITRGLPWGLYHFARFNNVDGEAAKYLAGVDMVEAAVGHAPLYHMLDLEHPATVGDVTAWSERWCRIVEATRPAPILIYCGQGWANQHLRQAGTGLEARPLWVANYANAGTRAPAMPPLWSDWVVWQWTSTPTGLGSLDTNVAKPALFSILGAPAQRKEDLDVTFDEFLGRFGGGYNVTVYEEPDGVWRGYGAGQAPPPGSVVARSDVPVLVAWVAEAATEARQASARAERAENSLARIEGLLAQLVARPAGGPGGAPTGKATVSGTLELRPAS